MRTTPEPTRAQPGEALQALGFHVWSYRADGTPALAYRAAPTPITDNLTQRAAHVEAAEVATLIAPELGVSARDLEVVSVHPLTGWTTVFVQQHVQGRPVSGGYLVLGFQGTHLTSIKNELMSGLVLPQAPALSAAQAQGIALQQAQAWSSAATLGATPSAHVWLGSDDPKDARLAWRVAVSNPQPRAELTFHLDAVSGAILAVDDAVQHAEGEGRLRMQVHTINSDSATAAFTVPNLNVGGAVTDSDGEVVQPGSTTVSYEGRWARVQDASGRPREQLGLTLSGPYQVYDLVPEDLTQADPFVHTNIVKAFAQQLTPTLGWIDQRLTVNVNINDTCNAFWDGQTINFFRAGGSCNNTGQISSIVYHEFGHGYHQNLTRNVVGSVGEGTGDFLAATLTGDPIVGRGFSTRGDGIRRIDGNNRFPDDYVGQVHQDGLIWATALWDLREALIEKHGEWAGRILVDRAFVRGVSRGPGLGTAYPSILEGDDDDGDITNGTPNSCEINAAFNAHGLIESGQISHQPVPGLAHARILHQAPGRFLPDEEGSVRISAGVENASDCGSVDLQDLVVWVSREGGPWLQEAVQVSGAQAEVVLTDLEAGQRFAYRFEIEASGRSFTLGSEQSPLMGLVDPGLEEIFSESFEAGFGAWTHGPIEGDLHDDWQVAEPLGMSFDPFEAHQGQFVVGTDLGSGGNFAGSDGAAKPNRPTYLQAPLLSTEGMENVHLELWQHHAIGGTLQILIDGQTVYEHTGPGNTWSGGWRYVSIPLGEQASDRTDIDLRFEVRPGANNALGGWALDDLRLSGTAIPPPPPPPPPEMPEPPVPEMPGQVPTEPVTPELPQEPEAPVSTGFTRNGINGGCTCATPRPALSGLGWCALMGGLVLSLRRRQRDRTS